MQWIDTTVGEYCPFVYGKGLSQKKRENGEVPVYGSNGIVGFHNESYVKNFGLIIGRKGSVGAVHLSKTPFWPIDTSFYISKESLDELYFVYYLLKSLGLEHMNSDSAVPGLNRDNAHALPIRVPVNDEDRKTVGVWIAKFDAKIQLNTQTNQTLESIAQAIFKSWFVDFDPVKAKMAVLESGGSAEDAELAAMAMIASKSSEELAGFKQTKPKDYEKLAQTAALFPLAMQKSELGAIPEGWEVSTMGEEVKISGGGTPSTKHSVYWENGTIHWTTPKDISGSADKVLLSTARKITPQGLKKISSGLLPENTVLMSSRAPVGYLALAKVPVAVNQGYIAMTCDRGLPPEYVIQWCEHNMEDIKQRAGGTTFSEISKKNFKPIPVLVPKLRVLELYHAQINSLYELVKSNALEIGSLSKTRDALLSKLLSGETSLG